MMWRLSEGGHDSDTLSPLAQSWRHSRRTEGAMVYEGPAVSEVKVWTDARSE